MPRDWRESAACREMPKSMFIGAELKGYGYDVALEVCSGCPVRVSCLEECLSAPFALVGVWGGTTADDRQDRGRARMIAARGGPRLRRHPGPRAARERSAR